MKASAMAVFGNVILPDQKKPNRYQQDRGSHRIVVVESPNEVAILNRQWVERLETIFEAWYAENY